MKITVYVVTAEPGGPGPIFVGVFGTQGEADVVCLGNPHFEVTPHTVEATEEPQVQLSAAQREGIARRMRLGLPLAEALADVLGSSQRHGEEP